MPKTKRRTAEEGEAKDTNQAKCQKNFGPLHIKPMQDNQSNVRIFNLSAMRAPAPRLPRSDPA